MTTSVTSFFFKEEEEEEGKSEKYWTRDSSQGLTQITDPLAEVTTKWDFCHRQSIILYRPTLKELLILLYVVQISNDFY